MWGAVKADCSQPIGPRRHRCSKGRSHRRFSTRQDSRWPRPLPCRIHEAWRCPPNRRRMRRSVTTASTCDRRGCSMHAPYWPADSSASTASLRRDGELFLNVSGSAWTSVSTLFEGSSKLKIALLVQTICVKLFSGALTGSVTLAAFAANLIVKALCALIVFVASIIVLEILFSLLSKLLSKIVEKQKGFRSVDRIIGLVFSAAFTVALVFVAMFVIAKVGSGTICYKEYFKVLFLNQAKQVLGYTLISEGGITETCADVRVILQAALLTNSVAIILAHNHPSGNLKPSRQDMEITKQVKEAARLMRITVTDHLILTDAGYYSFADEGEL